MSPQLSSENRLPFICNGGHQNGQSLCSRDKNSQLGVKNKHSDSEYHQQQAMPTIQFCYQVLLSRFNSHCRQNIQIFKKDVMKPTQHCSFQSHQKKSKYKTNTLRHFLFGWLLMSSHKDIARRPKTENKQNMMYLHRKGKKGSVENEKWS